jgi:predicted esterase
MKNKVLLLSLFYLILILSFQCGGKKKEVVSAIEVKPEVPVRYVYRLPENYDPNQSYPLLIVMHGYQSDESKGAMLWDEGFFFEPNFILLSIRAPFKKKHGGYTWVTESDSIPYWIERRKASAPVCEERILEILEDFGKNHKIEKYEIYLWGLSAAAPMAYYIVLNNPDVFAGLAIGSGLIDLHILSESMLEDLRGIDIFLAVGGDEKISQSIKETKEVLEKAGARVRLEIGPGGHILTAKECRSMQNFFGLCDTKAPEDNNCYQN